jgi:hypothetical protein
MRRRFITLVLAASLSILVQLLVLFLHSPPFNPTGEIVLRIPMINLVTYESLFYHALAIPFVAVLVYTTIDVFDLSGTFSDYAVLNVTVGHIFASLGAWTIILLKWNPVAHAILFVGLSLSFLAGISLLIAVGKHNVVEVDLISARRVRLMRIALLSAIFFVLATSLIGFYATLGSSQWGAVGEIERFRLVVAAHRHTIITVCAAAIVILSSYHFGAHSFEGTRGFFVDAGLYLTLIGIPLVSVSTYAAIPFGVAAHNVITPSGAMLLQGALFIMYAIFADFIVKSRGANPIKAVFGDAASFGLLFTFFWVNVAVTLPGIYVAIHLDKFVGLRNEIPFVLGHEHALIVLTAVALFLLVLVRVCDDTISRKFAGALLTVGYVVATGAALFYIFLDPVPHSSFAIPYMQAGIVMLTAGFLSGLIVLIKAARSKNVKNGR